MPYICKKNVRLSGEEFAVGAEISIDDTEERDRLVKIGAIYKDEADLDVAVDDSTKEEVLATQEDIISAMELLEVNDVPLSKKPTIAEIAVHIPNSKISGDAVKAAYDVYIAA